MTASRFLRAARSHLNPTGDGHRVTSLELFFDLVFVYAITNISALVEHHVSGRTVVEAAIVLSLVWFGWCSYAWLGNQARADEGLLRVGLVVAMAGMFFVAISIPYAFTVHSHAAAVLLAGYTVVRLVHLGVYLVAAGDDTRLRSVILGMLMVFSVVLVLLVVGAVVDAHARLWWWLAAVAVDQAGVYFVRSTRWRLPSASHFAERFGNIVLIAIGESLVGLGLATSVVNVSSAQASDLLCGFAIAVTLWWAYFDIVASVAERTLTLARDLERARIARDSYTYLHLPMIAGIESTALGLGLVIRAEHADAGRLFLFGGIALYLFCLSLLRRRNVGQFNKPRLVLAVVFLVLVGPFAAASSEEAPVNGSWVLAVTAALLVGLVSLETYLFRDARRELRRFVHPKTATGTDGREVTTPGIANG